MKKCIYLILLVLIGLPLRMLAQQSTPTKHPNFIVILADDLGWTSLSTSMDNRHPNYKSTYFETPNIDRLGNEGMRFSRGYAATLCSPSRKSIQFGQNTVRVGKKDFVKEYHIHKWLTIPRMLKSINSNYEMAHFGKWDLRMGVFPEDLGYDESSGNTGNDNGDRMVEKYDKATRVYLTKDPKRTVSLTSRALNFMQRQVNSGHPFYLQVSYYATHVDLEATKKAYHKFLFKKKGEIQKSAGFAAMLYDMDTGIGKILDMVQKLGISNNTYIIFLGDNGGIVSFPPPHERQKMDTDKTYNYPLRGGKWVLYEGGIRVPFIIAGHGISSHSYCHIPVREDDILPTIADLASDKESLPNYIDGGSIKSLFKNSKSGKVVRSKKYFYFHQFTKYYEQSAVVAGNYKVLIRWKTHKGFKKNSVELYNLKDDIGELHNLAKQMPHKASELKRKLISYLEEQKIDIPQSDIRSVLNSK
jgi:arylsulfatase A-like enzyme